MEVPVQEILGSVAVLLVHSFIPRPGIVLGAEDAAVASGLLPTGHSLWE